MSVLECRCVSCRALLLQGPLAVLSSVLAAWTATLISRQRRRRTVCIVKSKMLCPVVFLVLVLLVLVFLVLVLPLLLHHHHHLLLLLLLIRQMETPVSSMEVAVHRSSPQATTELAGYGVWSGRTAADVLLSDCQYCKGTALYGRCLTASTARALLCKADV